VGKVTFSIRKYVLCLFPLLMEVSVDL